MVDWTIKITFNITSTSKEEIKQRLRRLKAPTIKQDAFNQNRLNEVSLAFMYPEDEQRSGLDHDWSQFWPVQDWIGLQFFWKWRIRTTSDWENFFCFNVIMLNMLTILDPITQVCWMVAYISPSNAKLCWDNFAIKTVSSVLHILYNVEFYSRSNVNIVEWLVSILALRMFFVSALTIFFGLACRGYTFDRSALMYF